VCPVCLATLALTYAGIASTGGLTALFVRSFVRRLPGNILAPNHHLKDWTFLTNGRTSVRRFDFRRKQ
jgi:hypothetical protein